MLAITVVPGVANSARISTTCPTRRPSDGAVLVRSSRSASAAPTARSSPATTARRRPARDRLVLGHESLGRVRAAPAGSGFAPGDLVVGIVRRPDPVPCPACARRRVGHVPQRPLHRARHQGARTASAPSAFASSRSSPSSSIPASATSACCWSRPAWSPRRGSISSASVAARASWEPRIVLVTGAGPIGLLAALLGAQRGLEVHVLDRIEDGAKPELVRGARRHLPQRRSRRLRRSRAGHRDGVHRRAERGAAT